ncbi:hypothetical protein OAS19_04135 [Altererythrobacter sp.]|nr:hypothetical protein [Altererythrobacter sp.]
MGGHGNCGGMDVLQLAGSLMAILLVAGLAAWLKLGPAPRLSSDADARKAANEVEEGFTARTIELDQDGAGAILSDHQGRIMILKRHGSHFAGRILAPLAVARSNGRELHIDSGERRYGTVTLTLDDCASWEQAINAVEAAGNA